MLWLPFLCSLNLKNKHLSSSTILLVLSVKLLQFFRTSWEKQIGRVLQKSGGRSQTLVTQIDVMFHQVLTGKFIEEVIKIS